MQKQFGNTFVIKTISLKLKLVSDAIVFQELL